MSDIGTDVGNILGTVIVADLALGVVDRMNDRPRRSRRRRRTRGYTPFLGFRI